MTATTLDSPVPFEAATRERLGLTLFLALALHAIVILGVSFTAGLPEEPPVMNMEITLVHQHSAQAPEEADYLAQANQLGGGDVREKVRATSPFSNPNPVDEQGIAPHSRPALAPPPLPEQKLQTELLTADRAARRVPSREQQAPVPPVPQRLTPAQLLERSREIARMAAEINRIKQTYQQSPRHTYVNGANARQYRFAAYLDAWRAKVEEIGRINYPQEALRQRLSGALLLDTAIKADGTLAAVRVLQSSGHKALDDAAMRIVRLAAPFPPLPEAIRRDTDILHVTRIFRFKLSGRLNVEQR